MIDLLLHALIGSEPVAQMVAPLSALLMAPCIVRHGSCLVVQGPTSLLPVGGKPLKHTVLSFYTMYR